VLEGECFLPKSVEGEDVFLTKKKKKVGRVFSAQKCVGEEGVCTKTVLEGR
jgi:hypothetical protein